MIRISGGMQTLRPRPQPQRRQRQPARVQRARVRAHRQAAVHQRRLQPRQLLRFREI